jgi:RecA-family ATPase
MVEYAPLVRPEDFETDELKLADFADAGPGEDSATEDPELEAPIPLIAAALAVIPDDGTIAKDDEAYGYWIMIGLAIAGASSKSAEGRALFDTWSQRSHRYDAGAVTDKWRSFRPRNIGFGTLAHHADLADPEWLARYDAQLDAEMWPAHEQARGPEPREPAGKAHEGEPPREPAQPKPKKEYKAPTPANIRSWAGRTAPAPEFVVDDRIPAEQVFLFSGEGGGGKSSMVEHLCAAHAIGRPWLGCGLRQGPAIYLECEDAERILWWRLEKIAAHYGVPIETFADAGLLLYPLVEHDTILAATNKRGIVEPTQSYKWLYELAGDIKPVQIGIASVANTFAGSEITRTEVQQFIKLLARITAVTKGALTLVSQPSLTGLASTNVSHENLSGTTQWHNSVRGRAGVKIVKPKEGEGNGIDTGLRTLTFYKNQYGPPVAGAVLHWQNGLYLPIASTVRSGTERAGYADELTLTLLARFTAQNRTVSINRNPNNYAPSVFAATPEAEAAGITAKEFTLAMDRLLTQGIIENAPTKGSKGKHGGRPCLRIKSATAD